jgi:hypothetical protein
MIPPELHPEALYLLDLSKLVKIPTEAEQLSAVSEMQLDFSGAPMSYSPYPNPPHSNPYLPQNHPQPGWIPPSTALEQGALFPGYYSGTELPSLGQALSPRPVPIPSATEVSPSSVPHYAPQPSRAAPTLPSGPPAPTQASIAPSTPPTMPSPAPIPPELLALEAQLRGQAIPPPPDGASVPPVRPKAPF